MSDSIKLSIDDATNGIMKTLTGMINRGNLVQGWLNRVAYPTLVGVQRTRWQTEGSSQGKTWMPLNANYARSKLRRYRDYPGSGRKMLIATGKLVDSMTGDNQENHYKLVTSRTLEMGSTLDYAKWVDQIRDITELNDETIEDLSERLGEYLVGK